MLKKYSTARATGPGNPYQRRFNRAARFFCRADLRATEAQIESFQQYRTQCDPVADRLVERLYTMGPGGRRLFEQALEHGIETLDDPPAEMKDFFAAVDHVPYWVDPERLDRAARLYAMIGDEALAIFIPALAVSYLASETNQVLVRSGDLHKKAGKRAVETLSWFNDVIAPQGMSRFSPGYKGCIRIRMTHAFMRRAMRSRTDWDAAWGEPVHQAIYLATILPITLLATLGGAALGIISFKGERREVFHLWRFIAHVIGIDSALIPTDEHDTWRLMWIELDQVLNPNPLSAVLGGALWASLDQILPFDQRSLVGRIARTLAHEKMAALAHLMLGRKIITALAFPRLSGLGALILATTFVAHAPLNLAIRIVPGGVAWMGRRKGRQRARLMARIVGNTHADLSYARG